MVNPVKVNGWEMVACPGARSYPARGRAVSIARVDGLRVNVPSNRDCLRRISARCVFVDESRHLQVGTDDGNRAFRVGATWRRRESIQRSNMPHPLRARTGRSWALRRHLHAQWFSAGHGAGRNGADGRRHGKVAAQSGAGRADADAAAAKARQEETDASPDHCKARGKAGRANQTGAKCGPAADGASATTGAFTLALAHHTSALASVTGRPFSIASQMRARRS